MRLRHPAHEDFGVRLRLEVYVHEAGPLAASLRPFEVTDQRPDEVAADANPAAIAACTARM
jgi:hypothetical protein